MARVEWVKQRFENWALWKERENRGGLGFYTSSSFTWTMVDTSGYRELLSSTAPHLGADLPGRQGHQEHSAGHVQGRVHHQGQP
jgi:hypothetical protein